MTTSSDRVLLRWLPLAVLLAAAAAVLLTVIPHPYGYHRWPQPETSEVPVQVVRVAPDPATAAPAATARPQRAEAPVAEQRRDASVRPPAEPRRATDRRSTPPAPLRSPSGSGPGRSGGDSRGHHGGSHGRGGTGPSSNSGSGSGDGESSRTPLAEAPHRMPPTAQAKPGPELATPPTSAPEPDLDVREREKQDDEGGRGNCGNHRGHGHRRAAGSRRHRD